MEDKSQNDESDEEQEHKYSSNSARSTVSSSEIKRPILSKEDELTGVKFEVNINEYDDDNYVFNHVPDMSKPEYDPRRYFSYKFKHSPPRPPKQETDKKDRFKIVLDHNGTFSCIDEDAKNDLSFDTRYPNYFGDDFKFIKYPPPENDFPQERPCYSTVVKGNSNSNNVFEFTPWRERAERAAGNNTPIERTTIHLSDLDLIDDNEPHTLLEERDNETFYNEHLTRLLETGPLDQENIHPTISLTTATDSLEDNNIENSQNCNASVKSDTYISVEGSDTSSVDEFDEIAEMLREVTMETVYQTSNPLTKFRTVEEFIESENILQKEFKKVHKRVDKFAWYTFNYGEKVETPPPREQLHLFFDPEFKKWADPPPPSECSDEEDITVQPFIYQDCEEEFNNPNPKPEYWLDFDAMREIGRPVAIYDARDFHVYNTDVKPLWIDSDFDFQAPIPENFVTFDDYVFERNSSEDSSDSYEPEESEVDEPPPDACDATEVRPTPEICNTQEIPTAMYQNETQPIPQNYYPVQGYAVQTYQQIPQTAQRYYTVQRYPVQYNYNYNYNYNAPQMYNTQEMYRPTQYVPQTSPMYYPVQRYPVQYVPEMYNTNQEMYRGNQYVPQTTAMYYPVQRYPVQYNYNVPHTYNTQEMYRPVQNVAQYNPQYYNYTYQRVPVQYNTQDTYNNQERYNTNQNVIQTNPNPSPLQRYPVQVPYNVPEINNVEQDKDIHVYDDGNVYADPQVYEEEEHQTEDNVTEISETSPGSPTEETNLSAGSSSIIITEETEEIDEAEEMDRIVTSIDLPLYPLQRCPVHYDVSDVNDLDEEHKTEENVTEITETSQSSPTEETYLSELSNINTEEIEEPDLNADTNRTDCSSLFDEMYVSDINIINIGEIEEPDQNLTNSTEDDSQEYLTPAESPVSTESQTPKESTTIAILPEHIIETYASKLKHLVFPQSPPPTEQTPPQSPTPSEQGTSYTIPLLKSPQSKNVDDKTQSDNETETERQVRRVFWRSEVKPKKVTEKSDKKSNTGSSTASNASSSTNVKNLKLLFKEPEQPKKTPEKNVSKLVVMKKTQSHPALSDSKNPEGTSSTGGKQVKRANTEPWLSVKKKGKPSKSGKDGKKSKGSKNTNTQKTKQQKHQKSKNG